ncbi:MAG: NlpC/P60 family protein [Desulfomicrobium sp.]|nr:NlpC/P60 family protein [Desulfomicrobium sp.]
METSSALPVAVQETAVQHEERQACETQTLRHREFNYSSLLTRDNDYFTTSALEYGRDGSLTEELNDIEPVPSIKDIVLAQYEDWHGVRYRTGGTDYRGVDCSGLVQAIFRDAFEVELPRTSREQANLGEAVKQSDIQPGDLVYFIDRGRNHVGVAVNEYEFLHASRKKGVILSKFDKYWKPRLKRVRRILDETEIVVPRPHGG